MATGQHLNHQIEAWLSSLLACLTSEVVSCESPKCNWQRIAIGNEVSYDLTYSNLVILIILEGAISPYYTKLPFTAFLLVTSKKLTVTVSY